MCSASYLLYWHYEDYSDAIVPEMMALTQSNLAWARQRSVTYDIVGYHLGCLRLDKAAAKLTQAELASVQLPF